MLDAGVAADLISSILSTTTLLLGYSSMLLSVLYSLLIDRSAVPLRDGLVDAIKSRDMRLLGVDKYLSLYLSCFTL